MCLLIGTCSLKISWSYPLIIQQMVLECLTTSADKPEASIKGKIHLAKISHVPPRGQYWKLKLQANVMLGMFSSSLLRIVFMFKPWSNAYSNF